MRLGFVGVGKHAQKMAAAFRECGASIVAYDRQLHPAHTAAKPPPERLGQWQPWPEQVASPNIDALIICAPPEVTTEVALACAKAGKRCMATKPLMVSEIPRDLCYPMPSGPTPEDTRSKLGYLSACNEHNRQFNALSSGLHVDLWRLLSPAWQALKAELRGKRLDNLWVNFYGDGPVRQFSPALDWGPHALAFLTDLLPVENSWKSEKLSPGLWRLSNQTIALGIPGDTRVLFGNECPLQTSPRRMVIALADGKEWSWSEERGEQVYRINKESIVACTKDFALRAFCRAFLSGEPSDTLRLSCEAMKVLMPLAGAR